MIKYRLRFGKFSADCKVGSFLGDTAVRRCIVYTPYIQLVGDARANCFDEFCGIFYSFLEIPVAVDFFVS